MAFNHYKLVFDIFSKSAIGQVYYRRLLKRYYINMASHPRSVYEFSPTAHFRTGFFTELFGS